MAVLEALVKREGFAKKHAVTVRCYNNEVMTREYARELFHLITVEYGVPKARFISPTLDGAAHLFNAANDAGAPEALVVFTVDDARTGGQVQLPGPVPQRPRLLTAESSGSTSAHMTAVPGRLR